MLVVYPLPDKGYRYSIRRGSGLFISCKAFGDASVKIDRNIIPRFFRITTNVKSGMDATPNKTMEKYLKYFVLMLAAALSLSLTACGGGDDDEPENPDKPSTEKYEVVTQTIDVGNDVSPHFIAEDGDVLKFCEVHTTQSLDFYLNKDYYSSASNLRFAKYGTVSSLSAIKSLKDLNWIQTGRYDSRHTLPLEEKCGYVFEGTYAGRVYYIRLFINSFNKNSSGTVIGINMQYQQFVPAE